MRLKNSYFYSVRENVKDEDSVSGNLLVRGGFIKKTSSGIYMYLPLGLRVLRNIENIIREEMNNAGSEEVMMPALISEEYFEKSGRNNAFGKEMFRLEDRFNKKYALGPTHEELFALAGTMKVKSFKDLPFNLYQIQTKYRDEARARYGLIRVREFLMKDAYSFDKDEKGLDDSYNTMYNAYKKIFGRLKINYKVVKADTGKMGGSLSEEFQAVTGIGEDTIVLCDKCDFASNIEVCSSMIMETESKEKNLEKDLIYTPDAKTIDELSNYLNETKNKFVKTIIYNIDNKLYAVLVKGDSTINDDKLAKLMNANSVSVAPPEIVKKYVKTEIGFVGPIDINIPIIMDNEVEVMANFIVGSNKKDYHYKNVNIDSLLLLKHKITKVTFTLKIQQLNYKLYNVFNY